MPESEFEKQVQQELEQLKLRPTAEVWQNVEKELRKKKRRRVVFFIFLLAGLALLGYPGYKLFNHSNDADLVQNTKQGTNNTSSTSNPNRMNGTNSADAGSSGEATINVEDKNKETTANNNDNLTNDDKQPNATTSTSPAPNVPEIVKTTDNSTKPVVKKKSHQPNSLTTEVASEKVKESIAEKVKEPTTDKNKNKNLVANESGVNNNLIPVAPMKTDVTVNNPAATPSSSAVEPVTKEPQKADDEITKAFKADSTAHADSAIASVEKAGENQDSAMAKSKKGKPKFEWGIDLSAGVSSSAEDLSIGGQKSMAADQLYYSAPTVSIGTGILGQPSRPPSVINPGFAFRIGMVGELKLSKRGSFVTGLQYSYKSNVIHVGSYQDTTISFSNFASQTVNVRAVYRGNQKWSHTNKYHFIQVPISYQLQLNKSEKLPFFWNAGLGVSYLFATNGLLYSNTQGGIYYNDKVAYNRFQFNINTAFYLRFGNQKRMSWMIGPEFSMNTNRLVKEAYGNKQYLLYGGVTGRIYLPSK